MPSRKTTKSSRKKLSVFRCLICWFRQVLYNFWTGQCQKRRGGTRTLGARTFKHGQQNQTVRGTTGEDRRETLVNKLGPVDNWNGSSGSLFPTYACLSACFCSSSKAALFRKKTRPIAPFKNCQSAMATSRTRLSISRQSLKRPQCSPKRPNGMFKWISDANCMTIRRLQK